MENYTLWIVLLLVISVITAFILGRKLRQAKKLYYNLLNKNAELENFNGYRAEVNALRQSFIQSLPEGMNKLAMFSADLNEWLRVLEADYSNHHRHRGRARVWQSPEVKKLRDLLYENKNLSYRLDLAENKHIMALTMLKEKYGEEGIDAEWTNYLMSIKKEQEERDRVLKEKGEKEQEEREKALKEKEIKQEEKMRIQKIEEGLCKERIKQLNQEIKKAENKLENISDRYYAQVVSARVNLSKECSTPEVLQKISYVWANYKFLKWEKAVDALEMKSRPISEETAAEFRQRLSVYKKEIYSKYKEYQYKYDYLISLFPEIQEYIDGNVEQNAVEDVYAEYEDRREKYLSKEEWSQLSETEKTQLALDRYNERRKRTNAQVGRDYEEYIAYLFRKQLRGCEVIMFGEQRGLSDLGRDLIVRYKDKTYIVQCKRWSVDREIKEKHIMQLFGTTIEYCWDMKRRGVHPLDMVGKSVIPVFVTTAKLSDTARQFAEKLDVVVAEVPNGDYPQIKCNIGREGERIFHLPFDQQYNRVIIEREKGEFMAWTVKEAEEKGFRRAKKYYNV